MHLDRACVCERYINMYASRWIYQCLGMSFAFCRVMTCRPRISLLLDIDIIHDGGWNASHRTHQLFLLHASVLLPLLAQ